MTLNELREATRSDLELGRQCNVIIKRSRERGESIISIAYADEPRPRYTPIQSLLDFIR